MLVPRIAVVVTHKLVVTHILVVLGPMDSFAADHRKQVDHIVPVASSVIVVHKLVMASDFP